MYLTQQLQKLEKWSKGIGPQWFYLVPFFVFLATFVIPLVVSSELSSETGIITFARPCNVVIGNQTVEIYSPTPIAKADFKILLQGNRVDYPNPNSVFDELKKQNLIHDGMTSVHKAWFGACLFFLSIGALYWIGWSDVLEKSSIGLYLRLPAYLLYALPFDLILSLWKWKRSEEAAPQPC